MDKEPQVTVPVLGTPSAPLTLQSTYAAGNSKLLETGGMEMATLYVQYVPGSGEAAADLVLKLEFSPDNTQVYRAYEEGDVTAKELTLQGGTGGTTYLFRIPVALADKFLKVSAKETGVVTNFGTVSVRATLTPDAGGAFGIGQSHDRGYYAGDGSLYVTLYGALTQIIGGIENDAVLTAPKERSDSFQDISYANTNVSAATAQSIKAATADKRHYITNLTISCTAAAGGVITIDDADGTVLEQFEYTLPFIFKGNYADKPLKGGVNKALRITSTGADGNLKARGRGYTI